MHHIGKSQLHAHKKKLFKIIEFYSTNVELIMLLRKLVKSHSKNKINFEDLPGCIWWPKVTFFGVRIIFQ